MCNMLLRICVFLAIAQLSKASFSMPHRYNITFPTFAPADNTTQLIDCHSSVPDLNGNHSFPRNPFLPNSTEPRFLDSDILTHALLEDEPLCPQSSIHSVQLRKYNSWVPDWRHEFVVIAFACQGEIFFIRFDRSWEGTGWREWIPLPTFGSTKPATNNAAIYFQNNSSTMHDTTEVVAQIDFYCGFTFKDIRKTLGRILREAGPYSLGGMNCWSWSRYLYSSITNSSRNFILAVNQSRAVVLSPNEGRPNPWLEYANHVFENSRYSIFTLKVDCLIEIKAPNPRFLTVYYTSPPAK